jgi:hypothetical protein
MTEDKIVDRVRKLLELASSDNPNEAENAAKQAQLLMTKHNISQAMLQVQAADEETEESPEEGVLHRHSASTMPQWKINLGACMARVNQCEILINGNALLIVGRPADADTVRYLLSYVCEQVDTFTQRERRLLGAPGRTYLNNFRLGMVERVNARLREAQKEARATMKQEAAAGDDMGTGTALVVVNKALARIDARAKAASDSISARQELPKGHPDKIGSGRSRGRASFDAEGRQSGRRAGDKIDLGGRSAGSLGSGNRKALGS